MADEQNSTVQATADSTLGVFVQQQSDSLFSHSCSTVAVFDKKSSTCLS